MIPASRRQLLLFGALVWSGVGIGLGLAGTRWLVLHGGAWRWPWVNATGCDDTSDTSDPVTVVNAAISSISITKVADTSGPVSPGQIINYNITVCNTGAKTLLNVQVSDNLTGSFDIGTLAPNACNTTMRQYTVKPQDATNGSVVNFAEATAVDGCGDTRSDSATVTLMVQTECCWCAPYPQFTDTNLDSLTVQFADTSEGPVSVAWSWDFGDGTSSNQQNPIHTYANGGSYTVIMAIKWADCNGVVSDHYKSVKRTMTVAGGVDAAILYATVRIPVHHGFHRREFVSHEYYDFVSEERSR